MRSTPNYGSTADSSGTADADGICGIFMLSGHVPMPMFMALVLGPAITQLVEGLWPAAAKSALAGCGVPLV